MGNFSLQMRFSFLSAFGLMPSTSKIEETEAKKIKKYNEFLEFGKSKELAHYEKLKHFVDSGEYNEIRKKIKSLNFKNTDEFQKLQEFKSLKTNKQGKSIIMDFGIEDSAKESAFTEIITNLDFRADRILLPELVCKKLSFNDSEEVVIKFMKNKLIVAKF